MQTNEATLLGLDPGFMKHPRRKGTVYNVGIARNYIGTDSGNVCVLKWKRHSHHCDDKDHLRSSVKTANKAAEIIYNFLHDTDTKGWIIKINKPKIVECDDDSEYSGKRALVEPYIKDFQKFNSNTGWAKDTHRTYGKVLQALSHYSYVWSSGQYLLCDIQGGIREEEKLIILSDPAILTSEGRQFGCSDTGGKAIRNFFYNHKCSSLCDMRPTPKDKKLFWRPIHSTVTTME